MMIFLLGILFLLALLTGYLYLLYRLLKQHRFFLLLMLLLMPWTSLYVTWRGGEVYAYYREIPEALDVGLPVMMSEQTIFRMGCGVAVFRLSAEVRHRIDEKGLAFFSDARQVQGHADSYYRYGPWRPSPVPDDPRRAGSVLLCPMIDPDVIRDIDRAAREPGAYYTEKPQGRLLVIPSLGYVVFSFTD